MSDITNVNRKHICVTVSDIKRAVLLLEQNFKLTDYTVVESDTVRIFDLSLDTKVINRAFVEVGIEVAAISIKKGNLEEHFKIMKPRSHHI